MIRKSRLWDILDSLMKALVFKKHLSLVVSLSTSYFVLDFRGVLKRKKIIKDEWCSTALFFHILIALAVTLEISMED